jgi:hypothetical protein
MAALASTASTRSPDDRRASSPDSTSVATTWRGIFVSAKRTGTFSSMSRPADPAARRARPAPEACRPRWLRDFPLQRVRTRPAACPCHADHRNPGSLRDGCPPACNG